MTQLIAAGSLTPYGAVSRTLDSGSTTWRPDQTYFLGAGVPAAGVRYHAVSHIYQPEDGVTMSVFMGDVLMTLVDTFIIPPDETGIATTGRNTAIVQVWDCGDALPTGNTVFTATCSSGQPFGWHVHFLQSANYHFSTAASPGSGLLDVKWMSGHGNTFGNELDPGYLAVDSTAGGFSDRSGFTFLAWGAPGLWLRGVDSVVEVPPSGTPTTTGTITLDIGEDDSEPPHVGIGLWAESGDETLYMIKYGLLRPGGGGPDVNPGTFAGLLEYEPTKECYFIHFGPDPDFVTGNFALYQNTFGWRVIGEHAPMRIGNVYTATRDQKIVGVELWAPVATTAAKIGIDVVPDTPEYINPWTPVSRVEIDLPTGWVEGRNVVTLDEVDQFTWLAGQRICIWQYIDLDEFMWSFSGGQFVLFDPGVTTAGYTVGLGAGGLQGHMFHEPSHPTDWEAWDMGISVSGENWPIYPRACEPDGPDYVSGGAVGDLSIASQIAFPATDQGGVQQHPIRARPWVNGFYGLLNPAGSDPGTAWVTTGATKPYDEGGEIAWDTTDLGPYVHAFRADGTYHNHVDVFPDPGNYLHHYLHSPVVEPEFFWPFQWTFALGDVKAPSLHGVVDSHDTQPWWRGSHTQKLDFSLSALFNQGSFWQGAGGGTIPNWDINVDTSIGYEELGQGQHPDTSNSAPIPFTTTMAMPWGRWMLSVVDENGFDTGVRSDEGGFNPPNPLFDGVEQVNVPWGVLGITVKARIGSGQGTRVAMIG